MVYDYSGFPPHTYQIVYPAPGSPAIAARVHELLTTAGIPVDDDGARGYDHGTFAPVYVMYPDASVPIVQLSLQCGYRPDAHLAVGRALAPLRDEDVLVMGSGLSWHNLRMIGAAARAPLAAEPKTRTRQLLAWETAPALLLQRLAEDRFPTIWMPSTEYRDLRSLLLHRHQWVRMRTRVQNALHAMALAHGVRRGHTRWNREGQALLASLPLAPHTAHRRSALQALYQHLDQQVDRLGERVKYVAEERPRATLLMTHPGVGAVTALATEVGDPCRFPDGKAVASYVGMIPSEYSSGKRQRLGALSKQGNPFLRFLWCEAAAMRCDGIRTGSASIDERWHRRDSRRPTSRRRGSWEFAAGSCCAIRSITRNSAVVAWRGSRKRGVCAGMPVSALVLVRE